MCVCSVTPMWTLRVKLTVPSDDAHPVARATFETVSEVHEDQAIFQINETAYVDADTWGFKTSYSSGTGFMQTTNPATVERAMAAVAPVSFDERLAGD